MIQYKSKHPYSSRSNRWYKLISVRTYQHLNFEDYSYIIGDKIFREESTKAEEAFEAVKLWLQLKIA